jgi:hypothetical protein
MRLILCVLFVGISVILTEQKLDELKLKACEYMESLSNIRGADFNAGQAYAIRLMFQWIQELNNDNQ